MLISVIRLTERCQSVRGIHLACHAEAVAALAGSARSCFPSPPCVVWEPCLCDGGIETLELLGQVSVGLLPLTDASSVELKLVLIGLGRQQVLPTWLFRRMKKQSFLSDEVS